MLNIRKSPAKMLSEEQSDGPKPRPFQTARSVVRSFFLAGVQHIQPTIIIGLKATFVVYDGYTIGK